MHRCLGTCLIAQWRLKKDASKNRAKLKNLFFWQAFSGRCAALLRCSVPKTARLASRTMHQKSAAMPRHGAGGLLGAGRLRLAVMGFGKRQDHLANDLALRGGELQKSIEGFALQIAHPLFPALAVLQHRLAYAFAKA